MKLLNASDFFEKVFPKVTDETTYTVVMNELGMLDVIALRAKYDYRLTISEYNLLKTIGKIANQVLAFDQITDEYVSAMRDKGVLCQGFWTPYKDVLMSLSTLLVCKLAGESPSAEDLFDKLVFLD